MAKLESLRRGGASIQLIADELGLSPTTVARAVKDQAAPIPVPRYGGRMKKKCVPIRFPPNIMEMLDNWESCPDENVGW